MLQTTCGDACYACHSVHVLTFLCTGRHLGRGQRKIKRAAQQIMMQKPAPPQHAQNGNVASPFFQRPEERRGPVIRIPFTCTRQTIDCITSSHSRNPSTQQQASSYDWKATAPVARCLSLRRSCHLRPLAHPAAVALGRPRAPMFARINGQPPKCRP